MITSELLDRIAQRAELLDSVAGLPAGTIAELVQVARGEEELDPDPAQALRREWVEKAFPVAVAVAGRGAEFSCTHVWDELRRRGITSCPDGFCMKSLLRKLIAGGHATVVRGKRTRGGRECRQGSVNSYQGIRK